MPVDDECVRLTTYFGERDRTEHGLLGMKLCDFYAANGVEVNVMVRGIEGFGARHNLHTDLMFESSQDLPMVSVAIDRSDRIHSLLPALLPLGGRLTTLETIRSTAGEHDALAPPRPHGRDSKLSIYLTLNQRARDMPAFVAVCELLYRRRASSVVVLRGVAGSLNDDRFRRRLFSRANDVPIVIVAVGPSEHIAKAFSEVREILPERLLTLQHVQVCKHEGRLIATPQQCRHRDGCGLSSMQKLTVYSLHGSAQRRPLNREIVRRLRASEASGATSLSGMWGFCGNPLPGRCVRPGSQRGPVMTIVVDTPEAIQEIFPLVDELTDQHALVTNERVLTVTSAHAG